MAEQTANPFLEPESKDPFVRSNGSIFSQTEQRQHAEQIAEQERARTFSTDNPYLSGAAIFLCVAIGVAAIISSLRRHRPA